MKKKKIDKILYKAPDKSKKNIFDANLSKEESPVLFIEHLFRLEGLPQIKIIHKRLKLAAEFSMPNSIYIDFNNSANYIRLCIAHEYAHLLLRKNISVPYPVEQCIAILSQLAYEHKVGIRKFNKKIAKELMVIMRVWPAGEFWLKEWSSFWSSQCGKKNKNQKITEWVQAGLNKRKKFF